jgi:hypothetical protein
MSSDETNDPNSPEPTAPPCRHLRSKGMYVYTDGKGGQPHDDYDNTIYWCLRTMKEFGPDDETVAGPECQNPSRTCYEPF